MHRFVYCIESMLSIDDDTLLSDKARTRLKHNKNKESKIKTNKNDKTVQINLNMMANNERTVM
jgi:hypothetical protein